jgi:hypothetical protein
VSVFDWHQPIRWDHGQNNLIPRSIQDPADMSINQLRCLRRQGII